jgi:hypothetical protein
VLAASLAVTGLGKTTIAAEEILKAPDFGGELRPGWPGQHCGVFLVRPC